MTQRAGGRRVSPTRVSPTRVSPACVAPVTRVPALRGAAGASEAFAAAWSSDNGGGFTRRNLVCA